MADWMVEEQACIDLGYEFIGYEIDKEYYEVAKERINAKEVET